MLPPKDAFVSESESATWWIDDGGIVCSVSKKTGINATREEMIRQFENFKKTNTGKKVCILFDISHAKPSEGLNKEREFLSEEMATIVKAMAVISSSALGRLLANLFFNLKAPAYPMRVFDNEHDARQWLRKYNSA